MKRAILAAFLLASIAAHAVTTVPISLLNTTGSLSGQVIASTGPGSAPVWTTVTLSGLGGLAKANNLSDLVSASTARTNLGLGTAAVVNTGTTGANVPLLSAANTWSLAQTFTVRPIFNGNTPYDTGNVVALANGGTNAATAAAARTNLGAAASGANSDITSLNAPALGAATAPTATAGTNTTQVATTAFAQTAVTGGGNPGSFTTLGASGNDALLYTNSSAQSIPTGTATTITGWTKTFDRANTNFSASTGTFTAPSAGYYHVSAQLCWASQVGVASAAYQANVVANGATVAIGRFQQEATATVSPCASVSVVTSLSAGQTVVIQGLQSTGAAYALIGGAYNYVSISRIP